MVVHIQLGQVVVRLVVVVIGLSVHVGHVVGLMVVVVVVNVVIGLVGRGLPSAASL